MRNSGKWLFDPAISGNEVMVQVATVELDFYLIKKREGEARDNRSLGW